MKFKNKYFIKLRNISHSDTSRALNNLENFLLNNAIVDRYYSLLHNLETPKARIQYEFKN
jgi:hypothetical protein